MGRARRQGSDQAGAVDHGAAAGAGGEHPARLMHGRQRRDAIESAADGRLQVSPSRPRWNKTRSRACRNPFRNPSWTRVPSSRPPQFTPLCSPLRAHWARRFPVATPARSPHLLSHHSAAPSPPTPSPPPTQAPGGDRRSSRGAGRRRREAGSSTSTRVSCDRGAGTSGRPRQRSGCVRRKRNWRERARNGLFATA